MNQDLENFLKDLVFLIQERCNDSLNKINKDSYGEGQPFAYFDVINLIQSQAFAFGYERFAEEIEIPNLMTKVELNSEKL